MTQSFTLLIQRPDFGKIIAQYKRGEIPALVQVRHGLREVAKVVPVAAMVGRAA